MAKSYVTQYTEYVSEQQDKFRNKLKAKGLSPSPNATLGSLVSDLDSLQESFGVGKYERDPNFPDIDTMFDNDPLRAVNGGKYAGCSYFIMQVTVDKLVGFKFSPSTITANLYYFGEKIIVSDGAEYENITGDWTHTVGENGIFYGENGLPYCLLKVYRTDFIKVTAQNSNYALCRGIVELIEDTSVGFYAGIQGSYIGAYTADNTSLEYFRYVGSNATEAHMGESLAWYSFQYSSSYYGALTVKCVRVDGMNKFIFNGQAGTSAQKFLLNGQSYATNNNIGTSGTSYPDLLKCVEYFKMPYNKTVTTSNVYIPVKDLFIPDSYTKVTLVRGTGSSYSNGIASLEKIHLGSGLESWITQYSSYLANLKHITTSANIFGINTTAITIDLSYSTLLTKQAVLNLFNGVADRTGMTANIVKLPARIKSFLTDEEKAILTNKNWTLS